MAEYQKREKRFNEGLGAVFGSFAVAAVDADSAAKDATIDRYITLLDRGNVDFSAETSLVGLDEKLQTGISVPVIAVAPVNPIVIEEAELKMSMTVSAHDESSVATDTKIETSASGKVLFGPRISIKASVAVHTSKKRSSDYTATTDARMLLRQGLPPEGLMKIIDAITSNTMKGLEINERLIDKQAERLTEKVDTLDALPEAQESTEQAL